MSMMILPMPKTNASPILCKTRGRYARFNVDGESRRVWQETEMPPEPAECRHAIPYNEIYGVHPREFVTVGRLFVGQPKDMPRRSLSHTADPYTGKVSSVVTARNALLFPVASREREEKLRATRSDGAAYETPSAEQYERFLAASVSKKKKPGPKRLGAKRVKDMERLNSTVEVLNSEGATLFRALAARAT